MAIKFGKKNHKQHSVIYTIITAFLLCTVFLSMVGYLYTDTEEKAYENLHVQTKQIKDDIILQLKSDRENLATMANFASKLYADGEGYDIMFESFKAIGLIDNIGILNPDNTFMTKAGTVNLEGLISFEEEKQKGAYISGRVTDFTKDGYEIIRSAVPIKVNDTVVGVLYGVISLDKIGARYTEMVKELDAQLFVYDKETGNLVIDSVHDELGNISFLKERKYNSEYSYQQFISTDKGNTSFLSAYRNENVHMHYSTIDDIGWMIALVRYDSQVFADTNNLSNILLMVFLTMIIIMVLYILILIASERWINSITDCASNIRKMLLETSEQKNHIIRALKQLCVFAGARSTVLFDANGEDYGYVSPEYNDCAIHGEDRKYFMSELFKYATKFREISGNNVNVMQIKTGKHLNKTNPSFYKFLSEHKITEISFVATLDKANHTTILCGINPKFSNSARMIAERVAACFSMALYNKNTLSKTKRMATTDSLTGVLNRVAYKSDKEMFDQEKAHDFSCVYVDVNELHACNNKYGHAAGDEMLIYIANTLKNIFYGHNIYRMGGDEFVVICENLQQEEVKRRLDSFARQLKPMNYHVAIGMSYRSQNTNTEEMLIEAESRMYDEKALYYQNKELKVVDQSEEYIQVKTGIAEIDVMLTVLKENYNGIYRVSLDTDKAKRILMPKYLKYNENEDCFSKLFSKYVSASVDPEYHRAVLSFLNYETIKHQLSDGVTPKIIYKKFNGEKVVLSVYKIGEENGEISDTLWVFSKTQNQHDIK